MIIRLWINNKEKIITFTGVPDGIMPLLVKIVNIGVADKFEVEFGNGYFNADY